MVEFRELIQFWAPNHGSDLRDHHPHADTITPTAHVWAIGQLTRSASWLKSPCRPPRGDLMPSFCFFGLFRVPSDENVVTPPDPDHLLLESGDLILLETV